MNTSTNLYAGYRYPTEIISHALWLYFRFALSFRNIEELLLALGIILTYETVRQWRLKLGRLMGHLGPVVLSPIIVVYHIGQNFCARSTKTSQSIGNDSARGRTQYFQQLQKETLRRATVTVFLHKKIQ